jgi:CBS domain containing-hemolysin-like protein
MNDPWVVLVATVAIIAASAFFVAVEFAVIASRRPRLEDAAADSRSARAALRSASEVSVLLAGCQLGITACTLALGAVTKPAVDKALEPLLDDLGLPSWLSGGAAFALALLLVTFLHLVVGEMAPKSWAIAHPERSATLFAIPMRGFMWVFRPVLQLLNTAANALVRRVGVEPVEEVAIEQNADDLRQLVLHSAEVGELDERSSAQLFGALDLTRIEVRELRGGSPVAAVPEGATVGDVQAASRESGHLRILVGAAQAPTGLVHVRDTLLLDPASPLGDLVRRVHELEPGTTVLTALSEMRLASTQLAVVRDTDGSVGVVTMADMLGRLFPEQDAQGVVTSS